jgi:hypothetical protein
MKARIEEIGFLYTCPIQQGIDALVRTGLAIKGLNMPSAYHKTSKLFPVAAFLLFTVL